MTHTRHHAVSPAARVEFGDGANTMRVTIRDHRANPVSVTIPATDATAEGILYDAADTLNRIQYELWDALTTLSNRCANAANDITTVNGTVNSLGVVQGAGAAVDVLCARYADARAHLVALMRVYA